ncbi:hypothetical protein ANN_00618 [Periplaneta americana]|uniref:Uncharacterized protein n=1 Tax=Periplaneta americana TaxID=6978 RepID=A0ABQ8TTP0_PERAM|nr:hypothetical protein ANN_00618 [Periplaneta americana]
MLDSKLGALLAALRACLPEIMRPGGALVASLLDFEIRLLAIFGVGLQAGAKDDDIVSPLKPCRHFVLPFERLHSSYKIEFVKGSERGADHTTYSSLLSMGLPPCLFMACYGIPFYVKTEKTATGLSKENGKEDPKCLTKRQTQKRGNQKKDKNARCGRKGRKPKMEMGRPRSTYGSPEMDESHHNVGPERRTTAHGTTKNQMGGLLQNQSGKSMVESGTRQGSMEAAGTKHESTSTR